MIDPIRRISVTTALCVLLSTAVGAEQVPLGHKDFYPSPERVIGFRGDGNGTYPGATPVTSWTEGTPKKKKIGVAEHKGQTVWDFTPGKVDPKTGLRPDAKNICWKTGIRGFGNSHPIIVGDRAITTSDPYWLVCVDMHTGKIIWQRATSPFEMQKLSEEEIDQLDLFVDMAYAARGPIPTMVGNYTRLGTFTEGVRKNWMKVFGMCIPVIRKMIEENRYGDKAIPALATMEEALAGIDRLKEKEEGKPIAGIVGRIMWQGALQTEPPSWSSWVRTKYKFFAYCHWDGWCGWTLGSPASDGKCIYQWIGQGQVVCYDLAGNRKWGLHYPYHGDLRGDGMQHMVSPVLIGDVFVVQVTDELIGVNKRTGKVLWHFSNGVHHFAMGSPKHIRLKNGVDVVVPVSGKIVRVKDGKILGELGVKADTGAAGGGESMVGIENHVYLPAQRTGKVMGFELVAEGPDRVKPRKMWEVPGGHVDSSPIVYEDHYFRFKKGGTVVNWRTGQKTPKPVNFSIRVGGIGPTMAGKHFYWYESGTAYGRRRHDRRMVSECEVLELTGPGTVKVKSKENLLNGSDRPDMVRFKTHNPAFWAAKRWDPQGGVPGQFGYGGFCAQGNKMILRSLNALYCLGGPKVRYDWNPATRPKEVNDLLKAAEWPAGIPGIIKRLESPYRWEWEQGRKLAADLPKAEQAKAAAEIAKLLGSDSWNRIKASGLALQELGPAAGGTAGEVAAAAKKALAAKNMLRSIFLVETLMKIAPESSKQLEGDVKKLFGSGAGKRVACRVSGRFGERGAVFVPQLIEVLGGNDVKAATEAARALAKIGKPAAPAAGALGKALSGAAGLPNARKSQYTAKKINLALATPEALLTQACLKALKVLGPAAAPATADLAKATAHKNPFRAMEALDVLKGVGPKAKTAQPQLVKALKHPYAMVVEEAARTLQQSYPGSEPAMVNSLCASATNVNDTVTYNCVRGLRAVGPKLSNAKLKEKAVTTLASLVKKRGKTIAALSCMTLQSFGPAAKSAVPILREEAMSPKVRDYAKEALKKIAPGMKVKRIEPEIDDDLGLE